MAHTGAAKGEGRPPAQAEKLLGDAVGKLMEFWGFRKNLGRIWTLLYLEPEPLSAAKIAGRLRLAAGTVSMSLSELLRWGAIRKVFREGERKDFFEPETDLWRLITGILRGRERRLLEETGRAIEEAKAAIEAAAKEDPQAAFKFQRMLLLAQLTKIATTLLDQLLDERRIDASVFVKGSGGGK